MKARRKAREIALQFLYQWEVRGDEVLPEMAEVLLRDRRTPDVVEYVETLVHGTIQRLDEIDPLIDASAEHWSLARMAVVDRNVLRLATYEMGWQRERVPAKVAINEAIELGKRFSTAQTGAFVNGVLDRVRQSLGL